MAYVVGVFVALVVALTVALNVVGGRLFAAREKERANVLNVSERVAKFWLGLDDEFRYELTRRAREAGWGVAEWLDRLHSNAYEELSVKLFEMNQLPDAADVERRLTELVFSPLAQKPPTRSLKQRMFRFLYT